MATNKNKKVKGLVATAKKKKPAVKKKVRKTKTVEKAVQHEHQDVHHVRKTKISKTPWENYIVAFFIVVLILLVALVTVNIWPELLNLQKTGFSVTSVPDTVSEPEIVPIVIQSDNQNVVSSTPVSTSSATTIVATTTLISTSTQAVLPATTINKLKILTTPTGWLNVRDNSSVNGKILDKVNSGEEYIYVLEQGGWFKIVLKDGSFGWILGKYTEKVPEKVEKIEMQ